MRLAYKDRAKELLEGVDAILSPPPAGFVELPTGQDFEYAAVLADGRWQTGVASVDLVGSDRRISFSGTYASSDGIGIPLDVNWLNMAATPAEVFCTVSAATMNLLSGLVEKVGEIQNTSGDVSIFASGAPDSFTWEPKWPGSGACPVAFVEFEVELAAHLGSTGNIAKAWKGAAIYSADATAAASLSVTIGSENTDFTATASIDSTSGFPVLVLDYENASSTENVTFKAKITAKNIDHPSSCW